MVGTGSGSARGDSYLCGGFVPWAMGSSEPSRLLAECPYELGMVGVGCVGSIGHLLVLRRLTGAAQRPPAEAEHGCDCGRASLSVGVAVFATLSFSTGLNSATGFWSTMQVPGPSAFGTFPHIERVACIENTCLHWHRAFGKDPVSPKDFRLQDCHDIEPSLRMAI